MYFAIIANINTLLKFLRSIINNNKEKIKNKYFLCYNILNTWEIKKILNKDVDINWKYDKI